MSDLPERLRPALRSLAVGLNEARLDWRLGGSAMLATLDIDGTGIDISGDFCVRTPRGRVRVPQDVGGTIDIDGVEVSQPTSMTRSSSKCIPSGTLHQPPQEKPHFSKISTMRRSIFGTTP